jgi:hypothetical protein
VFLIILVVLACLGGVGAVVGISKERGTVPVDILFLLCVIFACNIISALYLYKKAGCSKVEWALFGAFGNLNALLFFWLFGRKQDSGKSSTSWVRALDVKSRGN